MTCHFHFFTSDKMRIIVHFEHSSVMNFVLRHQLSVKFSCVLIPGTKLMHFKKLTVLAYAQSGLGDLL